MRAAQASRGAAFEDAGLVRRLRAYGGLVVPVLVGLFRRADRLAAAMEGAMLGASGETDLACRAPFLRRRRSGSSRRRCRLCRFRARSLGVRNLGLKVVLVGYRDVARSQDAERFVRLRSLLALCPCRRQLAYQNGGENDTQARGHAPRNHLAVEQHAGHTPKTDSNDSRSDPCRARDVGEPHFWKR